MLLTVKNYALKIRRNWFLTVQRDIFKIIYNLQSGQNKERGRNMNTWRYIPIYLCSNLCTYLFLHLCDRKKSFIKFSTLILYSINIHFWQMWHFDVKGTWWVGMQLSVILTETVERFNMWVAPKEVWWYLKTGLRKKKQLSFRLERWPRHVFTYENLSYEIQPPKTWLPTSQPT